GPLGPLGLQEDAPPGELALGERVDVLVDRFAGDGLAACVGRVRHVTCSCGSPHRLAPAEQALGLIRPASWVLSKLTLAPQGRECRTVRSRCHLSVRQSRRYVTFALN